MIALVIFLQQLLGRIVARQRLLQPEQVQPQAETSAGESREAFQAQSLSWNWMTPRSPCGPSLQGLLSRDTREMASLFERRMLSCSPPRLPKTAAALLRAVGKTAMVYFQGVQRCGRITVERVCAFD